MKEDMQLDLFGREVPVSQIALGGKGGRREKIKDCFRKMHGFDENHTCGECRFVTRMTLGRTYIKCEKIGVTHSDATDIRLSDKACDLFEKNTEQETE